MWEQLFSKLHRRSRWEHIPAIGSSLEPVPVEVHESNNGKHRVAIFRRDDGAFTYRIQRKYCEEEQHFTWWQDVSFQSAGIYDSVERAWAEAQLDTAWKFPDSV